MFCIWRGRGLWALGIPALYFLPPIFLDVHYTLLPEGTKAPGWLVAILLLLSGSTTTALGFYLNRGGGFWTIDAATGLQYFDKSARHSLYFVPMQYWGLLYCALAGLAFWKL